MIALCVLFLLFFGLLQIFHWCVAELFCEYAAYYSAKGLALGYRPELAWRSGRVAAIGISGRREGGDGAGGDGGGTGPDSRHQPSGDAPQDAGDCEGVAGTGGTAPADGAEAAQEPPGVHNAPPPDPRKPLSSSGALLQVLTSAGGAI